MSWGLPPRYEIVHQFLGAELETIGNNIETILKNNGFVINSNTGHVIDSVKKLSFTLTSVFAFARPRIDLLILITEQGRLTFKSNYNYNSAYGITMNDFGKQKRIINALLSEIIATHENN